jgi:tagaturonate epimerase
MTSKLKSILEQCVHTADEENRLIPVEIPGVGEVRIYPKSVQNLQLKFYFLARDAERKALWIMGEDDTHGFHGTKTDIGIRCPLDHANAESIRKLFAFTRPSLLGRQNSIGCGDRLGVANAGHIRAVAGRGLKPVLAQQSVRELERTKREAEDVMDAATWAVFQEGYKDGFGADADHLKTPEDIDRFAKAGFTMFTLDIGLYVVNEAARLPMDEIRRRASALPWDVLQESFNGVIQRYANKEVKIAEGFSIRPKEEEVLRSFVKYGAGIAQTIKLVDHLKSKWSHQPFEIELSVDETDTPTSPLEHFIIASELKRLGVKLMSLAPRFIGDFEKGIEYKGDLTRFQKEYTEHVQIAEKLGSYKISIHSGSDKFDVYKIVGAIGFGSVHVKTAGTSWLEALRTIAASDPMLFRDILDCARDNYDKDRKSYHVTAQTERTSPAKEYSDAQLLGLLSDDNARQILHVTFGTILSAKNEKGESKFKDKIMHCLEEHEDIHYQYLIKHFKRHIDPIIHLREK